MEKGDLFEKLEEFRVRERQKFYDYLDGKIKDQEFREIYVLESPLVKSYNIQFSNITCPNFCKYCYAQRLYDRKLHPRTFSTFSISDPQKVEKKWYRGKGNIYHFPDSHDIFPENVEDYVKTVQKMIIAGHAAICSTKPRFSCTKTIIEKLSPIFPIAEVKERFLFQFSIGSKNDEILGAWEPSAPSFGERLMSMQYAYENKFRTALSIEPMFEDPEELIKLVSPWVTDFIYIGNMKHLFHDIDIESSHLMTLSNLEYEMKNIVKRYRDNPQIFWSPSVIRLIVDGKGIYSRICESC
jgi:DNA repair photolyase